MVRPRIRFENSGDRLTRKAGLVLINSEQVPISGKAVTLDAGGDQPPLQDDSMRVSAGDVLSPRDEKVPRDGE